MSPALWAITIWLVLTGIIVLIVLIQQVVRLECAYILLCLGANKRPPKGRFTKWLAELQKELEERKFGIVDLEPAIFLGIFLLPVSLLASLYGCIRWAARGIGRTLKST